MDAKLIGQKIKKLRAEKGWKQKDLAKKTGINAPDISAYEGGKKGIPGRIIISKFSKALGVPSYKLTGEGETESGVEEVSHDYAGGFSAGSERYFEKTRTSDIDSAERDSIGLQASEKPMQEEAVKDALIDLYQKHDRMRDEMDALKSRVLELEDLLRREKKRAAQ